MLAITAPCPARAAGAPALLERHGVPGLLVPELDTVPIRRLGTLPAVPPRDLVFLLAGRAPPA
eukprot:5655373-Alexandrium_andersonii.AAC.1